MENKPDFSTWLKAQTKRDDLVGDLAKDAISELKTFERSGHGHVRGETTCLLNQKDYRSMWEYLYGTSARDALKKAYAEWSKL